MILKIYKVNKDAKLPTRGTKESSGLDLYASIKKAIILTPGSREKIPHGISISLSPGHEAQIRSRSGLAFNYGIIALTTGTIDADFRGEISTLLYNSGSTDFIVEPNMRISQMIVSKFEKCTPIEVKNKIELDESIEKNERKDSGWGSTGYFDQVTK